MSSIKTSVCPMCGDMVKAGCRECPRCGELLQNSPKPLNPWRNTAMANRWKATELHLEEKPSECRDTKIGTCPACGDLVTAEFDKCSHCGESLSGEPTGSTQKQPASLSLNRKAAIHLAENSPKRKKMNTCPTCGDIVRTVWGECPGCGESLEAVMAFPSVWYENPVTMDQERNADELINKSVKVNTCTLCGDMVREDWEECPRCGEVL